MRPIPHLTLVWRRAREHLVTPLLPSYHPPHHHSVRDNPRYLLLSQHNTFLQLNTIFSQATSTSSISIRVDEKTKSHIETLQRRCRLSVNAALSPDEAESIALSPLWNDPPTQTQGGRGQRTNTGLSTPTTRDLSWRRSSTTVGTSPSGHFLK